MECWIAKDSDGEIYLYEEEPQLVVSCSDTSHVWKPKERTAYFPWMGRKPGVLFFPDMGRKAVQVVLTIESPQME